MPYAGPAPAQEATKGYTLKMYCYCANFYSSVNCHNIVGRFGDRCKLCKAMNEGRSFRYEFVYTSSNQEYAYDSEAVADDSGRASRDENRRGSDDSGTTVEDEDIMGARRKRSMTQ